jgi:hypothetical protein
MVRAIHSLASQSLRWYRWLATSARCQLSSVLQAERAVGSRAVLVRESEVP